MRAKSFSYLRTLRPHRARTILKQKCRTMFKVTNSACKRMQYTIIYSKQSQTFSAAVKTRTERVTVLGLGCKCSLIRVRFLRGCGLYMSCEYVNSFCFDSVFLNRQTNWDKTLRFKIQWKHRYKEQRIGYIFLERDNESWNWESKTLELNGMVNSTTGKYYVIAFIWTATL